MKRRGRGAARAGTAAALLLLFAGCTGTGADEPGVDPTNSEALQGEVTFWDTTGLVDQSPTVTGLVDTFRGAHPGTTVEYVSVDRATVVEAFLKAVDEASAPDVVRLPASAIPTLASAGLLTPLDPEVLGDPDDIAGVAVAGGTHNGTIYGAPQTAEAPMLLARPTPEPPEEPDPWADWAAIEESGATVAAPSSAASLLPIVYATGGRTLDTASSTVLISTDESVAGFQLGLDLTESGALAAPVADAASPEAAATAARKAFVNGSADAMIATAADYAAVSEALGAEGMQSIAVLPPPAGRDNQRGTPYDGQVLAIATDTDAPDAAAALVAALTGAEAQTALAKVGGFPTRFAVYDTPDLPEPVSAYRRVLEGAVEAPDVPQAPALDGPLWTEWQGMLAGTTSARNGAEVIAGQWLAMLPPGYRTAD